MDGRGHGVELLEFGGSQPPVSWTDKAAMAQLTDQQISGIISQGDQAQKPNSPMPAFGNQLSSEDIRNVVAYIRTLAQ